MRSIGRVLKPILDRCSVPVMSKEEKVSTLRAELADVECDLGRNRKIKDLARWSEILKALAEMEIE